MRGGKSAEGGGHVAVAYLARMAEGLDPLRRFIQSYVRHVAGIEHDLVVIYKGFTQATSLNAARSVFSSIRHIGIEVSDDGFDIGAYLAVAPRIDHDYVCFMNTFTEIEADEWLLKLHRHASSPRTGIVGAMGSYESLSDSSRMIHKVLWLCNEAAIPYDGRMAYYYDFVIDHNCKTWKAGSAGRSISPWKMLAFSPRQIYRRLRAMITSPVELLRRKAGLDTLDEQFQRRWKRRVGPGGDLDATDRFPSFPNPHIRSNGFMVARKRVLQFPSGSIKTKMDACAFESGVDSLTKRVRREGLAALVVGKDGVGYDVQDWWSSRTFRGGDESNLLLSDNQSRMFKPMTPGTKATHVRITWGDYVGSAPADFPDLGFDFPINLAVTGLPQPKLDEIEQAGK